MARLILHVGAHKTGTSYLQRILHLNRDLLARHGVIYPDLGPNPAHHILTTPWIDNPEIAPHWYGPGGPEGLWQRIIADLADRDGTVILSAEPFSRMAPQAVDMVDLAARCRRFDDVTVVYVARNQVELAQSIWLQRAKTGGAPPVDRFVAHALEAGLTSGIPLDHHAVYQHLRCGFAHRDIRLADYHQLRTGAGGLLGGFCQLTGLELPLDDLTPLPAEAANISPDPLATLLATRLTHPDPPSAGMVAWVGRRLNQRYPKQRRCIFTQEEIASLVRKFNASNRAVEALSHSGDTAFSVTAAQSGDWVTRDTLTWEIWADLARGAYHAA